MKKIIIIIMFLVVFPVSGGIEAKAETNSSQIAIVDIKKILNESLATKSIQEQIEKKRKSIQSEISKQEEELRKTDQDLAQQRSVLSQEVFEDKVTKFKTEVVNAQRNAQNKRAELEKAYATALKEVEKVVISIVSELSEKKGFSIAMPKSNALFAKSSLDISNEVLSTLNDRLPKVKVKLEK